MKRFVPTIVAGLMAGAVAEAAPAGYFDLEPGITLQTGDTWSDDGERYRLYGVQSCIRGTPYTDKSGNVRDCGDASMAVLAAYIKDTSPICAAVATTTDVTFVMCYATIDGQRLDLGTLLITSGYAFAALNAEGLPYNAGYAVAEQEARKKSAGLWQFKDVQHPSILLSRNAASRASKDSQ
ncbi:thermonuclease family protein [Notoacmeibacter sp. MSK16QG-6]|uniref:thermonuclease family protein n=1 Tax=Notoacmeibacter sp. MSK16QG-6 TaxID=2957982 RepID=UPI00209ED6C5|nr:thermonuclease family protein [Notoacmeibacter sp. MSK16QG-6]MCP1201094.1 thermonuclease family protein [Notoacmeibacter sp. MSK16QG-6]